MNLTLHAVTMDCRDVRAVATFWSSALGVPLDSAPPDVAPFFASLGREARPQHTVPMMFLQVSEDRTVKNRVHLDLGSTDRAAEVERLVTLGAAVLYDRDEWGIRWTTLADPEGNEFCVATEG